MAKRLKITEYRERLDRTLASPNLTNEESLKSLVKNQILQASGQETEDSAGCGEKVIQKRTAEVANFLGMLRSVSDKSNDGSNARETVSQPDWKVKQDNEEYRVMYREGPVGVPFHTLLVEGYVDGPIDICLCLSVEVDLYAKWWPQSTIPTFKILSCKCLQKVRNGEQLALVRVKVSWPLSTREAIIHFFQFEYLEDDMLVVLFNSVSETENIDISTHGFTKEAIPEAKDVVRIDMVGGFALQKVTDERSYFRTIANMDIKLDFVPPALINFMSRQLLGNGFKLYQKAVTSRFTGDEDFTEALKGSLYERLREALYPANKSNGFLEEKEEPESNESDTHDEENETTRILGVSVPEEEHKASNNVEVEVEKTFCEIEELKSNEEEEEEEEEEESKRFDGSKMTEITTRVSGKRNGIIRLEVEQALGTLEKVISMVRLYGFNAQLRSSFDFAATERNSKENNADDDDSKSLEVKIDPVSDLNHTMKPSQEPARDSSSITNSRQGGSNSFSKEINHNKIAPISPEQKLTLVHCDTNTSQVDIFPVENGLPILNHSTQINYSNNNGGKNPGKEKRHRFCCFGFIS